MSLSRNHEANIMKIRVLKEFRQLVQLLLILATADIILRYFHIYTPLSLILPTLFYLMYLNIFEEKVDLSKYWWVFIPMIASSFLYLYLHTKYPFEEFINLWRNIYLLVFLIANILSASPFFLRSLNFHHYLTYGRRLYFLFALFLIIFFLIIFTTILFHFQLESKANVGNTHRIVDEDYWLKWFLQLLGIFASIFYLVYDRIKRQRSSFTMDEIKECKTKLKELFNDKEIFRNSELTFNTLSLEYNIEKDVLNYFFESYINKDFSTFLAEYRIAYAMKLIQNNKSEYTLETIAHESGYRSRTSFNKYFELVTGMIPTQYINSLKK